MADYYTFFATAFKVSVEGGRWLKTFVEENGSDPGLTEEQVQAFCKVREVDEPCDWPDFEYHFDEKEKSFKVWAEGEGSVDHAALAIQKYLEKFDRDGIVTISWANTCSRMRAGEFGGGGVLITATKIKGQSSWDWLSEEEKVTSPNLPSSREISPS